MHLDGEQVQRLLHRETAPSAEPGLRRHLEACPACRERMTAAERDEAEVDALLGLLDHPVPPVDVGAVVAAARVRDRGWGRLAAGFLLALGAAGVAYAAPGSPLPGWVEAVTEWAGAREPSTAAPAEPQDGAPPEMAGIAMLPGAAFLVLFADTDPLGRIHVTLHDGTEVRVRAPAGAATFTSDAGRLLVDDVRPGTTVEVEIPRSAPRVEIRVAGARVFLQQGAAGADERVIPMVPPSR